jgi:surface antigen
MEVYEACRFTRGPLASVFDDVVAAPIPDRLLRIVRDTDSPQPRAAAPVRDRGGLLAGLLDILRMPAFSPAVAIPALLAAAAGGWLVHYAAGPASPDGRGVVDTAVLQRALEVTPAGGSAGIDRGLTLMPKFTFVTRQNIWCRQYSLTDGGGLEAGGIACRNSDGVWQVLMQTRAAPAPRAPSAKDTRWVGVGEPPGDKAPPDNASVLDGVRAQVKSDDPVLNGNEVEQLIGKGWPPRQ